MASRFVIRIAQEYSIETETIAEAYAEMDRLAHRGDDRATFVEGKGMLAPASEIDRIRSLQESPNT